MKTRQTAKQIISRVNTIIHRKKNYIYRGEPECFPEISSSLYRKHSSIFKRFNEHLSLTEIEKEIIRDARRLFPSQTSNFEILTALQHAGGKTTLIDFSNSVYIALFFACYGSPDEDGRLMFLDTEKTIQSENLYTSDQKENILILRPMSTSNRVVFQNSAFVHVPVGCLNIADKNIITIPSCEKEALLEYLHKGFGIHLDTIYNDLQGFVQSEKNFSSILTYYYDGMLAEEIGDYKAAIVLFSKLIKVAPGLFEVYNSRGIAKAKLEEYDDAIADFDKSLEINQDYANAYTNRANAKSNIYDYDGAFVDYAKAIELKPKNIDAFINRASSYFDLKDYEKAFCDYDYAIKLEPLNPDCYYCRGTKYNELEKLELALADYNRAIDIDTCYSKGYNGKGMINGQNQQYNEAVEDFTKAIELDPLYTDAYSNRGFAKLHLGQYDIALIDYDRAVELNATDWNIYFRRGIVKSQLTKNESAIKDFDKAIELKPDSTETYCCRGIAKGQLKMYKEAGEDFAKVLELDPTNKAVQEYIDGLESAEFKEKLLELNNGDLSYWGI